MQDLASYQGGSLALPGRAGNRGLTFQELPIVETSRRELPSTRKEASASTSKTRDKRTRAWTNSPCGRSQSPVGGSNHAGGVRDLDLALWVAHDMTPPALPREYLLTKALKPNFSPIREGRPRTEQQILQVASVADDTIENNTWIL